MLFMVYHFIPADAVKKHIHKRFLFRRLLQVCLFAVLGKRKETRLGRTKAQRINRCG